jgi:hypothetical protein
MKRSNGPTFDASDKNLVRIILMALDKVTGSLLSGDGNQRNTFVGRLEPNNLRAVLTIRLRAGMRPFTGSALGLLLLLGGLATGTKQTKRAIKS